MTTVSAKVVFKFPFVLKEQFSPVFLQTVNEIQKTGNLHVWPSRYRINLGTSCAYAFDSTDAFFMLSKNTGNMHFWVMTCNWIYHSDTLDCYIELRYGRIVHCFWHGNRLCSPTQSSELTNLIVLRGQSILFNFYRANIRRLRKETVFTTSILCWSPPQRFVTTNPSVVMAGFSQRIRTHANYQNLDSI